MSCIHEDRTVANDNTVRYKRLALQIPADRHRRHYVKATVRVHEYPDGTLAVFHGPRCLARYKAGGEDAGFDETGRPERAAEHAGRSSSSPPPRRAHSTRRALLARAVKAHRGRARRPLPAIRPREGEFVTISSVSKTPAELPAKEAPKLRHCLSCQSEFESEWSGERVCPRCKRKSAWRAGAARSSGSKSGSGRK